MDTIFALASGRGKAGVAVIRVSGPRAFDIGRALTGGAVPVGRPVLRRLIEASGAQIDEALVLGFANGASFTGEATVEFHCHGSVAVTQALVRRLSEFEGTRLAEPGEFTRRALENDRLNLAQVEGLADLVDAETEAQRKQALRLLSGELGRLAHGWREKLVRAAALMEATIDFADEEVPVNVGPEVAGLLAEVRDALASEIRGAVVSERIRDGFEVAIVGRPNTGKSTLLNHIAGRDVAITSEIAGTTRDVLEVRLDLRGLPVTLLDTAGLREAMDAVEAQGIARARRRAENADLRVFLLADPDEIPELPIRADDIVVVGKADMVPGRDGVSGVTGEGVDRLVERLADILEKRASGAATATRVRQRLAMERAVEYTGLGIGELAAGEARAEYAAEEIRHAIRALDALIGRVDVEHLLDEIFRSFCLGK